MRLLLLLLAARSDCQQIARRETPRYVHKLTSLCSLQERHVATSKFIGQRHDRVVRLLGSVSTRSAQRRSARRQWGRDNEIYTDQSHRTNIPPPQ